MTSRLRGILLALLVVTSVLAGAVGPVAASHGECSELDEFFWVLSFGTTNEHCDSSVISHEMQTLIDSEDNQTHLDLYEAGASQAENVQTSLNTLDSYRQDTRTTAFIKAENATINGIQTGDTKSAINTSARQTVYDYYTVSQEKRLIETWNLAINQVEYIHDRAANETGVAPEDVIGPKVTEQRNSVDSVVYNGMSFGSRSYTFVNGSTTTVRTVHVSYDVTDGGNTQTISMTYGPGDTDPSDSQQWTSGDITITFEGIEVLPPSGSSLSPREVIDFSSVTDSSDELGTISTQVADNAGVYAATLYDAEQNGTINASTYVSPYVMAQEWSTSYNSTGYWSYAVAMLSASGLSAPDLNSTGQMTVRYNGVSYDGLLMSDTAPNDTWKTDTVYNGSQIEGYQWFITLDGERLELKDEFRLTEMTDEDGQAINSTKTVKYVYRSNNVTEFQELQQQVLELSKEIEEQEPTTGGGGGGGFDLGGLNTGLVIAIAAGAAVLLLNRS